MPTRLRAGAEATRQVWPGRSPFGGGASLAGPQGNPRVGRTVLARLMQGVRKGAASVRPARWKNMVPPARVPRDKVPMALSLQHTLVSQCITFAYARVPSDRCLCDRAQEAQPLFPQPCGSPRCRPCRLPKPGETEAPFLVYPQAGARTPRPSRGHLCGCESPPTVGHRARSGGRLGPD